MIYRHNFVQLPLHLLLSGGYIILKFTISPFLYAARKVGFRSRLPSKIDAAINKTILPLTESPDSKKKIDIEPNVKIGDPIPPTPVIFPDGKTRPLSEYNNLPLLLIFVRGSWCSYSRLHLANIMKFKEHFNKAGVNILAITSYHDQDWWRSKGIDIPMCIDTEGKIFKDFGIHINSWLEKAWGRTLPHESVFLFNDKGRLVSTDVRKVSNIFPGQKFLGSEKLIQIIDKDLN